MPLAPAHHAPAAPGPEGRGLDRGLILLMAVTTGAAVANIYYIQPLLHLVGDGFGVSDTVAGILVTCAQLGYLLGLAFLVPLGDLRERRRLITVVMVGVVLALALCAAAPDFSVLAVALIAVGALSVVAQILVPLAATLARPEERGQVVGTVMSGLLIGILSARIFSGLIAELGGFRLVFGLAAGIMLVLTLLLWRALPRVEPSEPMPYARALRSIFDLIGEEPVLRQRMGLAVLQMVAFLILWTSIAFLLSGEPYDYGEAVIGLFGLAGIAGALIAPVVGRLSDRGSGRLAMTLSLAAVLVSWAPLAAGGTSLIALIAGIVLLDLGIQGQQIANQSAIYALRPEARSRVNTAYMVSLFVGGVLGSLLASGVYGAAGWDGICVLGAAVAAAGLALWAVTERRAPAGAAGGSIQRTATRLTRTPSGRATATSMTAAAPGAAQHVAGGARVGEQGAERRDRAALGAAAAGGGHLGAEGVDHQAADGVAVNVGVVAHHGPPVGPKRSVLTVAGSWPSSTRALRRRLHQAGGAADERPAAAPPAARRPRPASRGRSAPGVARSSPAAAARVSA